MFELIIVESGTLEFSKFLDQQTFFVSTDFNLKSFNLNIFIASGLRVLILEKKMCNAVHLIL